MGCSLSKRKKSDRKDNVLKESEFSVRTPPAPLENIPKEQTPVPVTPSINVPPEQDLLRGKKEETEQKPSNPADNLPANKTTITGILPIPSKSDELAGCHQPKKQPSSDEIIEALAPELQRLQQQRKRRRQLKFEQQLADDEEKARVLLQRELRKKEELETHSESDETLYEVPTNLPEEENDENLLSCTFAQNERRLKNFRISSFLNPLSSKMVWYLSFFKWKLKLENRGSFKFFKKKGNTPVSIKVNFNQTKRASNSVSTCNYSVLTFLPKFLFHQLTQFANGLFLILTILQMVPNLSPFSPSSTGYPLLAMLVVSGIREVVEDLKRYQRDRRENNQKVWAHTASGWKLIAWWKLYVGQLVCIKDEEFLPADIVLISSTESGGIAYVETANLDGESSLKIRQAPKETCSILQDSEVEHLWKSEGHIECEYPNKNLHSFEGCMELPEYAFPNNPCTGRGPIKISLNGSHLLMRGSKLKNTDKVYGIVVYTGKDTKMMKNSIKRQMKSSKVLKMTDSIMCCQFGICLLLAISCSLARTLLQPIDFLDEIFDERGANKTYHGPIAENSQVFLFGGFLFLYTGLVPISMYVTLDMIMTIQAIFIKEDQDLVVGKRSAEVKMITLNSELGHVRYVMTDKTGTLTKNCMNFRGCSVGGIKYANRKEMMDSPFQTGVMLKDLDQKEDNADELHHFLLACAACHTVTVDKRSNSLRPIYHATSPDESALVNFAADADFIFKSRTSDSFEVQVRGVITKFKLLHIFEFNSSRKRMSVIVQDKDHITIYVKGADNVMLPRAMDVSNFVKNQTLRHLYKFACDGLRTLVFAYRRISLEEWKRLEGPIKDANLKMQGRSEALEALSELCENNLKLIGVSAIEDRLQDQVPETIEKMLGSNIRVWVLTGDKFETSINIGNSCNLLDATCPLIVLNDPETAIDDLELYFNALGERIHARNHQLALIVDASSLDIILKRDDATFHFLSIALCCSAVICCRCTPIQKAQVTRLVKENVCGTVLSVGDGANDVAMIQEADVGIGIVGEEGMQASLAADYSINQFCHLNRLIFVHGTLSLFRTTKCILFSVYKNVVEITLLMFFSWFTGFSDQAVASSTIVICNNIFFTSWPPLILGSFDRPLKLDVIERYQDLYIYYQDSYGLKQIAQWQLNGWLHGNLIFPLMIAVWGDGTPQSGAHGRDGHIHQYGLFTYIIAVVVVNMKFLVESNSITMMSGVTLFVSFGMMAVMFSVVSYVSPSVADEANILDQLPYGWLALLILLMLIWTLLPDVALKAFQRTIFPDVRTMIMRDEDTVERKFNSLYKPIEKVCDLAGIKKVQLDCGKYGFAFSQDDGSAVSQRQLLVDAAGGSSNSFSEKPQSDPSSSDRTVEASSTLDVDSSE